MKNQIPKFRKRKLKLSNRISYKQAKYTVLIALILGLFFSFLQIYWDYRQDRKNLETTIQQVLNIVEQTASKAAYSLDKEFAEELISGLFEYKPIYEASITDDLGNTLATIRGGKEQGALRDIINQIYGESRIFVLPLITLPPPLRFEEMSKIIKVGELRVEVDTYPIGINFLKRSGLLLAFGMIRNLLLALFLLLFFHRFLTKPFVKLEADFEAISTTTPEKTRLGVPKGHTDDEFFYLVSAANKLFGIIETNVAERIQKVKETERLKGELVERKKREQELKEIQTKLEESNSELKVALEDLKKTQDRLIKSEKMVALGELVASIAHEVNTPLGIGVTGASHMRDEIRKIKNRYYEKMKKESEFKEFLESSDEISGLILSNLRKAFRLIKSFKRLAVDQSSEARRRFNVGEYLEDILINMGSKLKKTNLSVKIKCDKNLELNHYAGAFSQVITNLILNSLQHAYDKDDEGTIMLSIKENNDMINMIYSDDGKGIAPDNLSKIFDPFFSTSKDKGGSGIGLQVIKDIITNNYNGTIECTSKLGEGVVFTINFPK